VVDKTSTMHRNVGIPPNEYFVRYRISTIEKEMAAGYTSCSHLIEIPY